VTERLLKKNAKIVAYDPMAIPNAKRVLETTVEYAQDARSALKDADCCIVMNEWDQFKKLKASDFTGQMKSPNVVDARRILDPEEFHDVHLIAIGLGRESS